MIRCSDSELKSKIKHYDSRGYTVDMTTHCNNKCLFCAASNRVVHRAKAEMKYELVKGREWGADRVDFTGGEPTLHPDLVELVAYAKRIGYRVINIKTNGRRLSNKDYLQRLVDAGLNHVLISVHGHTPEIHDALTQVKGSFDDVVKALGNLIELKVTFLSLTVLTTFNYKHLKETVKFCYDYGRGHSFAYIYPVASAYKNFNIVVPRYIDVKPYLRELLEYVVGVGKTVNLDNIPLCVCPGHEQFYNSLTTAGLLCHGEHKYRKECAECLYRPICEGISPVYIAARGWDEFIPVKEQKKSAGKKEKEKVRLQRNFICSLKAEHAEKNFGGVVWTGTKMAALTRKGYQVIKAFSEKLKLEDFARIFGEECPGFLYSMEKRGLVNIINEGRAGQENLLRQGNFTFHLPESSGEEPLPSRFSEFEYPLYEEYQTYPDIELI